MVEQALGLDKKIEIGRFIGKRTGAASSHPHPKRSKDTRGTWKSTFKSKGNRDRQLTVSVGSVRGPFRDVEVPICEHCGKKHRGEC